MRYGWHEHAEPHRLQVRLGTLRVAYAKAVDTTATVTPQPVTSSHTSGSDNPRIGCDQRQQADRQRLHGLEAERRTAMAS